jgi:tRNA 2-thiocytidine biosynthesis protein TtcA
MSAVWTENEGLRPRKKSDRAKIERETHKLEKRLCRQVGQAIIDYNMIEEGDRVMVCLSGGKDSFGLLDILLKLQARAPISFELIAVNLDQKQPGFPDHILPDYLKKLGVPFHIETRTPTASSKKWYPRARPCAACAAVCAGAFCTVWPMNSKSPRLRWATTATTCCKPSF